MEPADDAATGPAEPAADASTEPDPCDCYEKHFDAASCGDCECSCVLIATVSTRIDTKDVDIDFDESDDIETKVDSSVRRWIRPVLTGMCKGRKMKRTTGTTEQVNT